MTCSWCEARLAPFVDGELTARDRAMLAAHVASCASCASLLDELRVVDALLRESRDIGLAPDFTLATMAELRELPSPRQPRTPLAAFTVCYLVASWLVIAAAIVLSRQAVAAACVTALALGRTLVDAFGGIGHVFTRLTGRSESGTWPMLLIGIVAMQAVLFVAMLAIVRCARPAIAERLRP